MWLGSFFVSQGGEMSKIRFRKTEPTNVRGICVRCGKNPQKGKQGGLFRAICSSCDSELYETKEMKRFRSRKSISPYIVFKRDCCEVCGFVPKHSCQLDVDHINGNHKDNREENLQTLCANCHRLKSLENADWKTSDK